MWAEIRPIIHSPPRRRESHEPWLWEYAGWAPAYSTYPCPRTISRRKRPSPRHNLNSLKSRLAPAVDARPLAPRAEYEVDPPFQFGAASLNIGGAPDAKAFRNAFHQSRGSRGPGGAGRSGAPQRGFIRSGIGAPICGAGRREGPSRDRRNPR